MSLLTVAVVARRRWQIAAGMLSLLLFLPPDRARRVEMHVLDVGQGDGLLVLDGDRTLLIDGGGWREGDFGGRVLRPILVSLGVRRLDVAVVTHFDTDHCGGLSPVMRSLAIEELWVSSSWGTAPCVRELLLDSQARTCILWRGERVEWGAWSFRVLHLPPGTVGSSNDRSLVMVAEAFGRRALLTGDVSRVVEKRLVEGGVAVDVLKVAHHGSRTSTSEMFLEATRPRSASISVGVRNGYGHPAPEVLDRLRAHRIHVLRSDRDGMITWRFDERGARVRVFGRGVATRAAGGLVPVVLPRLQ